MRLIRTITAAILVVLVATLTAAEPAPAPAPRPVSDAELVRRLGSSNERERDEAARQLLRLDTEPYELLRATDSDNPEVRGRAVHIVTEIRRRTADRVMRRAEKLAEHGKADLMVANSAVWYLPASDERLWMPAFDLGRRVKRWQLPPKPLERGVAFRTFVNDNNPEFIRSEEPYRPDPRAVRKKFGTCGKVAILAPGVESSDIIYLALVVSRDGLLSKGPVVNSVLFVNGDVTCNDNFKNSVLIADGNVRIGRIVTDSIVVARGTITVEAAYTCTLSSGGAITFTWKKYAPKDPDLVNTIEEGESKPLGLITFFELSRVGLEAADKDKAVRVVKLTAASPLRKAGVAVGDVVMRVNGTPIGTAEELRRLTRDAVATKGEVTLTVGRDGKALDIRVPLPD